MAMVEVRSVLRGLLHERRRRKLSEIMQKLNRLMNDDLPDTRFVTLILVEIDAIRRQIQYAGAGHRALLFRADQGMRTMNSTSPPLGLMTELQVEDVPPIDVSPGDLIFICTDGLTEAHSFQKELFGWQRTADSVSRTRGLRSADIIRNVFADVKQFAGAQGLSDDMTAVAAKLLPKSNG